MSLPSRVDYTPEAAELLLKLTKINGPLMFHQSGRVLRRLFTNVLFKG